MPASFAGTQLESSRRRFGNPNRFNPPGNRSSGLFVPSLRGNALKLGAWKDEVHLIQKVMQGPVELRIEQNCACDERHHKQKQDQILNPVDQTVDDDPPAAVDGHGVEIVGGA